MRKCKCREMKNGRVQCFARWTEQHQIGIIDGRVENRQTKEFNNNNGNKEILRQITTTTMSWMRRRKFSRRMFSLKIHYIAFYFYYLMIRRPYRPRLVTGIDRHLAHTLCAFNNYRFSFSFSRIYAVFEKPKTIGSVWLSNGDGAREKFVDWKYVKMK